MNFQETLDYLYGNLPMYQRIGNAAFKKTLANTIALCDHLGNPQKKFKSIHIAGTNGKGSCSHMIASVLHCSGFKTGLYTSPHLKSFTERIKINGTEIDEDSVIGFVEKHREVIDQIQPSFFEMTVAMAFDHFARNEVDFAVIEVGLGGRLDSTNIVDPEISLITNISYDHQYMLGNTLSEIAYEKAGIIKRHVPVVIGEYQPEVAQVFMDRAEQLLAPIHFATKEYQVEQLDKNFECQRINVFSKKQTYELELDLIGDYQLYNVPGVLKVLELLSNKYTCIDHQAVSQGLSKVKELTGLKGRWQIIGKDPLVICDTGHNESGISLITHQLSMFGEKKLWMVLGMSNDKPVENLLNLLPKPAYYYFCEAKIPRAMDAVILHQKALLLGLKGEVVKDVNHALQKALTMADIHDVVFVGGSSFVVAEIEDL